MLSSNSFIVAGSNCCMFFFWLRRNYSLGHKFSFSPWLQLLPINSKLASLLVLKRKAQNMMLPFPCFCNGMGCKRLSEYFFFLHTQYCMQVERFSSSCSVQLYAFAKGECFRSITLAPTCFTMGQVCTGESEAVPFC